MVVNVDCLHRTIDAIRQIREALVPFLTLLDVAYGRNTKDDAYDSRPTKKLKTEEGSHVMTSNSDHKIAIDPFNIAEAEAAVALAMGTLRFMAKRLRGEGDHIASTDVGRRSIDGVGGECTSTKPQIQNNDPLRLELDKMRKILVSLKALKTKENTVNSNIVESSRKDGRSNTREGQALDSIEMNPRSEGAILNRQATKRMIKAALGGEDTKSSDNLIDSQRITQRDKIAPERDKMIQKPGY